MQDIQRLLATYPWVSRVDLSLALSMWEMGAVWATGQMTNAAVSSGSKLLAGHK
jgi:hypothetical protein